MIEVVISRNYSFYDLKRESWSGALNTLETIEEHKKQNELMNLLGEIQEINGKNVWDSVELNDFLWFDDEYIYEQLGIEVDK